MKIAAGVGIVILVFAFIARASIKGYSDSPSESKQLILTPATSTDITFAGTSVLNNLTIPAYNLNELRPISKEWQKNLIVPIVKYLKTHNEKVLKILSYSIPDEKEIRIGGYDSMASARAGVITQELLAQGISAPRIIVAKQTIDKDELKIPLKFEFINDNENLP